MVMFDLMASGLVKIAEIIYRTKAIESFFFFSFFFTATSVVNPALLLRLLAGLCQQTHSARGLCLGREFGQQKSGLKLPCFCGKPGQTRSTILYALIHAARRRKSPLCWFEM